MCTLIPAPGRDCREGCSSMISYLRRLEAQSIHIMRCSIGKDSSVMRHLARKAFHPSRPPFPLLHVDTAGEFPESCAFRDRTALKEGQTVRMRRVRFRTLVCRPLTGAIESATDIDDMRALKTSQKTGRPIVRDQSGSMERKNQEGCV